mmetsp:Transcript_3083/g.9728  ORF Transcript_3083/g.9728 Transcript_3083/m.9728 type:complete len:259 (-) Transcript_3083:436-1212(-)
MPSSEAATVLNPTAQVKTVPMARCARAAKSVLVINETDANIVWARPICRTFSPHTSCDSGPKKAANVAEPQLYNADTQHTVAMAVTNCRPSGHATIVSSGGGVTPPVSSSPALRGGGCNGSRVKRPTPMPARMHPAAVALMTVARLPVDSNSHPPINGPRMKAMVVEASRQAMKRGSWPVAAPISASSALPTGDAPAQHPVRNRQPRKAATGHPRATDIACSASPSPVPPSDRAMTGRRPTRSERRGQRKSAPKVPSG